MEPEQWQRVRTLFDELVELEPQARERRLALIAVEEPVLRDLLASLLSGDKRSSGPIRPAVPGEAVRPNLNEGADWLGLTGRHLSHFRILEPLGSGGMGAVYRADDSRLGRPVALKFPLPHTRLDPRSRERFLREARALAAVDHPNLCTIYEIGETPEGQLFIAMALYEGETLAARMERDGAFEIDEAVAIAEQVTAGLARAHAAGVVHRDLKPANIMLPRDGPPKLLDFGLARSDELSLTGPGVAMGTLAYMAPEQLRGERVDERADLWAVGAILYQMLTGRRPFGGASEAAIYHGVLTTAPIPPSNLRPDLPASLDTCVLRLLEKDPDRRYPSAQALAEALSEVRHGATSLLGGVPAGAGGHGGWRGTRPQRRWTAALIGGVALLAAALVVTLGVDAYRARSAGDPVSIAVLPFTNLSPDAKSDAVIAGLHGDVVTQLTKFRRLRVASQGAVAQYAERAEPPRAIADSLGVARLLEGTVQQTSSGVRVNVRLIDPVDGGLLWAEVYDSDAAGLLTLHRAIATAVAAELGITLSTEEQRNLAQAATDDPGALEAYWEGLFHARQLTPADLEIALDAFDRAIALDPDFALAWAAKSEACVSAFVALMVESLEPCAVAGETALALDEDLAEAHAAIAMVAMLRWEWERSEAEFIRALSLDPRSNPAKQNYGILLRVLRRPQEAMQQFLQVAEESTDNLYARTQIGWALFDQQRYSEALAQYGEVMRRDPTLWLPIYGQGLVYAILRDTLRLRQTIERVRPLTAEGAPHLAILEGWDFALRGRREEALWRVQAACGGPDSVRCPGMRAGILHALGADEEALTELEKAARLRDPFLPNTLSEPWFDDLGNHPRLVALRRRIWTERG